MSSAFDLTFRVGTPDYPILDAFRLCNDRVSVIMGPLGSGKTFASIQRIMRHMFEQAPNADGIRPSRWLAIRNTYKDLEHTTVKDFLAVFGRMGEMRWSQPPTFRARIRLDDATIVESEVIFLALDRIDDVSDLRGYQITGAWLNETKELVKAIVDMVEYRTGRFPSIAASNVLPNWHGWFGDSNAWDEDHYLFPLAEEETPKGWRFFRQPGGVIKVNGKWVPNPKAENLRNLLPGYYENGLGGKSDDWISVNLANEYGWLVDGKPVHPDYVDSVHCTPELIPFDPRQPIVLGVDYGRTPAAAIGQHDTKWGRLNVIDEFVSEDMSAAQFGPELRRYLLATYPGTAFRGWGDPAGDQRGQATDDTPRQVLNAAGVPILPAPSNDVILRRAAVSNPLKRLCGDGRPALQISPKAKTIRKGLNGGFCYRRIKVAGDERYTDIPDKNKYSHPVEALEYLELGLGEGTAALRHHSHGRGGPMQTMAELD